MNSNDTIRRAVLAVLGTAGAATGFGQQALAADATASGSMSGLEEVVVTAQRRTENIQNVPITIQALSGDQLKLLNVTSMNELLKYTSNVSYSGNGPPGTGNIFMRGLSSGGSGNQSQSTTAPFPNVALYLDDQSMQFPARNNDVYMVDLERVEILEGPQGTLFGGGSQAGAVRYITNKPKLGVTSGDFNANYGVTASGQPNSALNATLNLPLINDKLAVRGTIFSDSRGGYITNVPGAISIKGDVSNSNEVTNAGVQGSDLNTAVYQGFRLSALYEINEDWNVLLQQNYQNLEAHGYWSEEPMDPNGKALKPLEIAAFTPGFDKDKYGSTAWTVNGHMGDLTAVYTGSYMVRYIDSQQDYSNYARTLGSYYLCSGTGASPYSSAKPLTCGPPLASDRDQVRNTHLSHELRLQTSEDKRLRALVGAFYEDFVIFDNMNFNYLGIPECTPHNLAVSQAGGRDCLAAVGPADGFYAGDYSRRTNSNTGFGEDIRRGYQQTAFFGSIDFDLIPKTLTLTVGTRHYKYDEFQEGSQYSSYSTDLMNKLDGTVNHVFGMNLKRTESGNKSRFNLTWHVTPDFLAYYTYSEGFRPGGFNRTQTDANGGNVSLVGVGHYYADPCANNQPCTPAQKAQYAGSIQYDKPVGYDSDNLVNNEVGVKSEWLDHRLQVNLSAYNMDWKSVQLPLFDPTGLGNTTFTVNGPTYTVKGIELQLVARVTNGLTVQGTSSWNHSNQTDTPCALVNRANTGPTPVGQCIDHINGNPYTNPYGVTGVAPPYSPPLQFNVRAHYDWDMNGYRAYCSLGLNYTAHFITEPANFRDGDAANPVLDTTLIKYNVPSYTVYDAAIGTAKDNWNLQLMANNLSNNDAATTIGAAQYIKQVVPLRPRVITLQMGYSF